MASTAQAECFSNYGHGHSYVSNYGHGQKAVVYGQKAVYYPPALNITNVYPQGNTLYGTPTVSQYGQTYNTDPNLAIAAVNDQQKLTAQNLQAAIKLQLEAQTNQADIAKLQLASTIIKNALTSTTPQKDVAKLVIETSRYVAPETANVQIQTTGVLTSKCASCHGGAQPKGNIQINSQTPLTGDSATRIVQILHGQKVPKGMETLIEGMDAETNNGLLTEVLQLWEKNE